MAGYDVTVIGSGPGGYYAAIRCSQLSMKTAIIEKYDTLGGTCLNVGCIPSKAMLDSTHHLMEANRHFKEHGINTGGLSVDFKQMVVRKSKVVKQTVDGVAFLMKKNKIDVFHGTGTFKDKNTITVKKNRGKNEEVKTDRVIVATGSKPATLPGIKIDKKRVISSTEALELKEIPKKMTVIGGGYIGLEMGSVYNRLGTEITVLEYMDNIIPNMDRTLAKELKKVLKKQGIKFQLGTKVTGVETKGEKVRVKAETGKGGSQEFDCDYCLVAVGRKAYTEGLGLDKAGLKTNEDGKIEVNENLETRTPGIYAIGDVIRGAMLAHKAEDEADFVAEIMAGEKPHINYHLIPGVVYTWPEVASVGYTEKEIREKGREYNTGSFPFRASGRARASKDIEGLIKVMADKETDELLGVHMIGPRAADMIAEAVVAMEYRASAEDVARISHAHPTFTEAFREACLAATANRAIHI